MKVIIARTNGFCWGVRRAMDAALEASSAKDGKVQTLGPLIHNPQVLALLNKRGVGIIDGPKDATGGTVLIRAHGVPVEELKELKDRQAKGEISLVNATCPEVAKVHGRIKKWSSKGYFVVILGTHGHAESIAHRSFASAGSAIVSTLEEAKELPSESLEKVFVVAQTTFTFQHFGPIVEELKSRAVEIVVENTICQDTSRRQEEAASIASLSDCVVVVGGKNSSNTKHLAYLAQKDNKPVQFVEVASELDLGAYHGNETIGVLAGASTPTWLVDEVVDVLKQHGHRPNRLKSLIGEPLLSPVILSLGMSAMAIGMHSWMGLNRDWTSIFVVFAYALAMYLAQPYLDPFGLGSKGPARARYLERNKVAIISTVAVALVFALVLAASQGKGYAIFVAGASILGLAYKLRIRAFGKTFSLRAIPGSKDVLVTLALAIIGLVLPAWQQDHPWDWQSTGALLFAGALVFARSIIVSISDMQRDQILGRETLPILIGRNKSQFLMCVFLAAALAFNLFLASHPPQDVGTTRVIAILAICALYPILYQWAYRVRFRAGRPRFDPGAEPAFFLAGLLAMV